MRTSTINKEDSSIYIGVNDIWLNPQNKLVAENRAVASAFINQGSDLISDKLDALSYSNSNEMGFNMFASTYDNTSEYDTLSNFKINGFSSTLGMGYKNEFDYFNLSFLAFYENSIGNYRTYNSFDGELFRGFGELETNGGGIATRFEFHNGFYTEASLRAGNLKSSMQNALKDGNGNTYGYELNSIYYGAHIGAGKQTHINQTFSLDLYSKLFYTYTDQDSFNIGEEIFHFNDINSTRARIGLKSDAKINDKLKAYTGVAYEYEFNGIANMQINSYNLSEQNLQGSSYMAELGFNYQASKNFNLDIKGRGYLGKREGVSTTLTLNYKF
ncbi:autotransporter outer membrane beta-barrel domain-containing protein [Campylobacter sp. CCS1377]|uniref:Autotransporter outer membrane beta-barrel domain-containing protein n=1 Tax=Campylobacter sp. CCS1377 TaxID=3158229 RepID=A0AAU7E772_9BACT